MHQQRLLSLRPARNLPAAPNIITTQDDVLHTYVHTHAITVRNYLHSHPPPKRPWVGHGELWNKRQTQLKQRPAQYRAAHPASKLRPSQLQDSHTQHNNSNSEHPTVALYQSDPPHTHTGCTAHRVAAGLPLPPSDCTAHRVSARCAILAPPPPARSCPAPAFCCRDSL